MPLSIGQFSFSSFELRTDGAYRRPRLREDTLLAAAAIYKGSSTLFSEQFSTNLFSQNCTETKMERYQQLSRSCTWYFLALRLILAALTSQRT